MPDGKNHLDLVVWGRLLAGLFILALVTVVVGMLLRGSNPPDTLVLVPQNEKPDTGFDVLYILLLPLLLTGAAGFYYLRKRFFAPLSRIAQTCEKLAEGDFTIEVPCAGRGGALGRLAQAISLLRSHGESWQSRARRSEDRAEDLQERSDLLESALETIDQGLIVIDRDKRVAFCNEGIRELFDLPAGFGRTSDLRDLISQIASLGYFEEDDVDPEVELWSSLARQGRRHSREIRRATGAGFELRLEAGMSGSLTIICREISLPHVAGVAEAETKVELAAEFETECDEQREPETEARHLANALLQQPAAQSVPKAALREPEAEIPVREPETTPRLETEPSGMRVLLAECDKSAQLQAITVLDKAGHWVDLTTSGQAAVDMVAAGGYDAVFMDVALSDMTGFEATRLIRTLEGPVSEIPIYGIDRDDILDKRCLSEGMNGLLLKPLTAEAVKRQLAATAQKLSRRVGDAQQNGAPEPANRAAVLPISASDTDEEAPSGQSVERSLFELRTAFGAD